MITQEKINLYKQCKGNYQIWKAVKRKQIKIDEREWLNIETLLFCCYLNHNGLSYFIFTAALEQKLTVLCDDEVTMNALKELACSLAYKRELLGRSMQPCSPHQLLAG